MKGFAAGLFLGLQAGLLLSACKQAPPDGGARSEPLPQLDKDAYCAGIFSVELPAGVLPDKQGRPVAWIKVRRIHLLGGQLSELVQQRATELAQKLQLISRIDPLEGGAVLFYWLDPEKKTSKMFESYVVANGEDTVYRARGKVFEAQTPGGRQQEADLAGIINSSIESLNDAENRAAYQPCFIDETAH